MQFHGEKEPGDHKTDLACYTGNTGSWNLVPVEGQCFAADFNGDHKTDLACSNGVNDNWSVALSTGSGWNTESWSGGPVVELPMTQQCVDGDFNGDRKSDLDCWTGEGGGWAVALSTGKGWNASIWNGGPVPVYEWNIIPVPGQCFTADFNGDGITDVACYSGSNGVWAVSLSSGKGW